jgi:hypothetical protein
VLDDYELEEHERVQLLAACRIADQLEALHAMVEADGPVVSSPQGDKAHPALVEHRAQALVLARMLAALRLPSGDESDRKGNARPQRRVGVRGVHNLRGVAS